MTPEVKNPATNLTPNFSLWEMLRNETGKRNGLDNTPNMAQIDNLIRLCELLEDVRVLWGCPVHVNSAFRSPSVNRMLNGRPESQHIYGLAADIVPGGIPLVEAFDRIAMSHIGFDTVCIERNAAGISWIHISIPPDAILPRRIASPLVHRPSREVC